MTNNVKHIKVLILMGAIQCFTVNINLLTAQIITQTYDKTLDSLSLKIPELNNKIDISVSDVPIQEFLRAIAKSAGLNLNVDPAINEKVYNNFSNVEVKDVLVFLATEYNLNIDFTGSIIAITKKEDPIPLPQTSTIVQYDSLTNSFTIDCKGELLFNVIRQIINTTGKNIIVSPGLANNQVQGYIQEMPFEVAMEKFAYSNSLELKVSEDGFFILEENTELIESKAIPTIQKNTDQNPSRTQIYNRGKNEESRLSVKLKENGMFSVFAENAPLSDIIKEVAAKTGNNYFLPTNMEETKNIQIEEVNFETFLKSLLNESDYIYKKESGIFIIDTPKSNDLMDLRVIQFQNRSIDKLLEVFPGSILEGIEIKEYPDLNSLLLIGPSSSLDNVENLSRELDKVVPVILIEVIIVDVSSTITLTSGIDAGIGNEPKESTGRIFPGIDVQLGTKTINDIIQSLNGFGAVNIGNVAPNFYLTLKALESQGILKVHSTPKLSTLNGNEATMSIGNTEYYREEQSSLFGTQDPQLVKTETYIAVSAEFSLIIKPFVSGDDQITMEIEVKQSDFTERISEFAPPGSVNRNFKSLIRVKNQETVLLGGLVERRVSDTGSGTPFLSRIPLIKWLFSSRSKEDQNSKLSIFIKPTIIN